MIVDRPLEQRVRATGWVSADPLVVFAHRYWTRETARLVPARYGMDPAPGGEAPKL
jgi:hypothetical protein